MPASSPLVLCILDGWGYRENGADNSISVASTPHWDQMWSDSPHCLLDACAQAVGLPDGQMGNSEVGHMNLGAGRTIFQDLPRIDKAIADGELAANPVLQQFIHDLKASGGTCHLLGLLSDGGIHSHINHILALATIVVEAGIPVVFHPFLDGRDTPPQSAQGFLEVLTDFCANNSQATIGTVGGRYYGMDRDKRWDRIELAYRAIVCPSAEDLRSKSALDALITSYMNDNSTDEFVLPRTIDNYQGMQDGDGLLTANFRSDRMRQITEALLAPEFDGFERPKVIQFAHATSMTEYSSMHAKWLSTLFPVFQPRMTLGEVVAEHGLSQLRAAETEKYAHVTFFFNGGAEEPFPGETRILVPSPKVATYDLQPEMSAPQLTDELVNAIQSGGFDLIVCNYANPDMVGHTGNQEATVIAIETIDKALGRLTEAVDGAGGYLLVTADHGNAEVMKNPTTHAPHTAHTLNPVPFVIYGKDTEKLKLVDGKLADVAPTILELMNIPQPKEMTGESLLIC